jgi:hypothetical protein
MIVILGLVILVAALVVGVAGVLGNGGSAHTLGHSFSVLGYHVTGSTGTLFLAGIVIGAIGLFGLSLLLSAARRTSRRGSTARRGLRQSRRETAAVSQQRDDLLDEREAARAYTASKLDGGVPRGRHLSPDDGGHSGLHLPWRRPPAQRAAAADAQTPAGDPQPAAGIPVGEPAPNAPASAPAPAG